MVKEETDMLNVGDFTFCVTGGNDMKLRALIRYAQFLDYRAQANEENGNELSVDGLVNYLLSNAMDKMIKDIIKKHSFESEDDFYDTIGECKDGEELKVVGKTSFEPKDIDDIYHYPYLDVTGFVVYDDYLYIFSSQSLVESYPLKAIK